MDPLLCSGEILWTNYSKTGSWTRKTRTIQMVANSCFSHTKRKTEKGISERNSVRQFFGYHSAVCRSNFMSMAALGGRADTVEKNVPTFALNWKSSAKTPSIGRCGPSGVATAASIRSLGVVEEKEEKEELTLDDIRESLIRQEDSIIYNLLERAQYCTNPPVYVPGFFPMEGVTGSLVDYLLKETERLHAGVRRYTSPDEHAFFPEDLPEPILPTMAYPKVLHRAADLININSDVREMYFEHLLPGIAVSGDDGNYGSAATCDVLCLQALSKRIHYGKFVAEAKFRDTPQLFAPHIRAQDSEALYKLITFESVERAVVNRVEAKARIYGQEVDPDASKPPVYKIDPKLVAWLYGEWVMPLTKKVQVQYLLRRLD
ncbi:hypothetical protein R1flu_009740 [Riccia fluitans]|uniref:chorismate mutase n=1 Tax=Riccia fluitans TaxID=41844 RepID=A0ABD1Z3S6_9MARC